MDWRVAGMFFVIWMVGAGAFSAVWYIVKHGVFHWKWLIWDKEDRRKNWPWAVLLGIYILFIMIPVLFFICLGTICVAIGYFAVKKLFEGWKIIIY